tara:strand:+ start:73 stop:213 length:141 start_codon:yes stop_codon:yes gene_type:complete
MIKKIIDWFKREVGDFLYLFFGTLIFGAVVSIIWIALEFIYLLIFN